MGWCSTSPIPGGTSGSILRVQGEGVALWRGHSLTTSGTLLLLSCDATVFPLTIPSLLRFVRKDCSMFEPLLPLNFLRRAARLFPAKTAVVDGARRYTYHALEARVH